MQKEKTRKILFTTLLLCSFLTIVLSFHNTDTNLKLNAYAQTLDPSTDPNLGTNQDNSNDIGIPNPGDNSTDAGILDPGSNSTEIGIPNPVDTSTNPDNMTDPLNQAGSDLSSVTNSDNMSSQGSLPITTTHVISSPLVQFKSGTAAKDVKCQSGFQLIIKAEDGTPACVRPNTASHLSDIGWAKIP